MRENPLNPVKLKAVLKRAGIMQGKFADMCGVSRKTMNQFLNGWLVISPDLADRIRKAVIKLEPLLF